MSKKKGKKNKGKVVEVIVGIPNPLAEAMMFAEDAGDCLDMIEAARESAEFPDATEYELERNKIIAQMTEEEIRVYDLIDNFINSRKAGLPEDSASFEAQVEHAEWNTEEYRMNLVHVLASFEASIAYYITVKTTAPESNQDISEELEEIQNCLDELRIYGRELEILIKLEYAEFRMDRASTEMNDAYEERDILHAQLEDLYVEFVGDDDDETPDD